MKQTTNKRIKELTTASMLCAIGIIIPLFSPIKIILEPASFTLGSHVALFLVMCISPALAIIVSIGTTFGFFLSGYPIVVVARAASHIVFAVIGAIFLRKWNSVFSNRHALLFFSVFISLIHGLCEVLVVYPFYFNNVMSEIYYQKDIVQSIGVLVGLGTFFHSLIDFYITMLIYKVVRRFL